MQITIFGGTGKVGRLVTAALLDRGHTVVALTHHASLPERSGLVQVKGDIYNRDDIANVLKGSQVVISALGSWGTSDKNVLSTAMERIIPAMESAGPGRIISLTGNISTAPGDRQSLAGRVGKAFFNLVAPKILRDGEDHVAMLAASKLDWTVVRSPVMVNGSRKYSLRGAGGSLVIARQAVAQAMVDLIESHDWSRQAPYISRS